MKNKIMLSFYNTHQIGGPSIAMRKLMDSDLAEKYDFVPIIINEKLGKLPRISVIHRLVKEIKKENPDVIYFTGMQLQGFYMALSSWIAGYKKRTIMVVRGSSCDAMNISKYFWLLFRYFIEPITCKLTEITHTVCIEMANNSIIRNNINIFGGVIHNAAPKITGTYTRTIFRREIGVVDEDILLVYTGRIIEDKGIDILLNALKKQTSNVKLVLVGDGNVDFFKEKAGLLNIEKQVFFMGRREDILSILAGSDIFVFPTFHENLSNALLEACAMGLPVIATNVGGNPEVIRDGEEGILVPVRNVELLAQAIQKLASEDKLRKIMGEKAKNRMERDFSQQVIFGQIAALFEKVIDTGRRKNDLKTIEMPKLK